jgi:hypothetical protein
VSTLPEQSLAACCEEQEDTACDDVRILAQRACDRMREQPATHGRSLRRHSELAIERSSMSCVPGHL